MSNEIGYKRFIESIEERTPLGDYQTKKNKTYEEFINEVENPQLNPTIFRATGGGLSFDQAQKYDISTKEKYEEQLESLKKLRSDARKENFKTWTAKIGTQMQPDSPEKAQLLDSLVPEHEKSKAKKDDYDAQIAKLNRDYDNQKNAKLSETLKDPEVSALVDKAVEAQRQISYVKSTQKWIRPQDQPTASFANNATKETQEYNEVYKKIQEKNLDANALIEFRTREKNAKDQAEMGEWADSATEKHPYVTGAVSVLGTAAAGLNSAPKFIEGAIKEAVTGEPYYVDVNDPAFALQNFRDQNRQTTSRMITREIDNKTLAGMANFAYQTGTSVLDWASIAWMPAPVALTIMGTNAGTSAAKEATLNGVSGSKALMTGLAAGAAEVVFEKFSLDKFNALKVTGKSGVLNRVQDILRQTLTEGSEEAFTDISNAITDNIINGDLSSLNQAKQAYIDSGMTEEEAQKQISSDFGKQIGFSFAGGALSGGVVGGAGVAINHMNTSATGRKINQSPNASGTIKALADTAVQNKYNSNSYQAALRMYDQKTGTLKTNLDNFAVGNLANSVQADTEQNLRKNLVDSYVAYIKENGTNKTAADKTAKIIFDAQRRGRISPVNKRTIAKDEASSTLYENVTGDRITNRQSARQPVASMTQQESTRGVLSPASIQPSDTVGSQLNRPTLNAQAKSSELRLIADNRIAEIKEIVKDFDGKTVLKTADNTTIKMNEAEFSSPEVKLVYEKALQMPTKDLSNKFVRSYNTNKEDGGTADFTLFNNAFRIFYKRGKQGDNYEATIRGSGYISNGSVSLRSASQAFFAGEDAANRENAIVIGAKKYGKGVTVESKKKLNNIQQMQVNNLNVLTKKIGASVVIADGLAGTNGFDSFNGAYKDNTVYINLSKINDSINYVAGHELVHHIKANNATGYKVLEEVVVDTLQSNENYNLDEEIQKMMNQYWGLGDKSFTRADAVEEIVAESCFDVLSNETNITNIVEQDKNFAQKIKDWLASFIAKLKEAAKELGSNRAEYKALQNDIEALSKIDRAFYSALLGTKKVDMVSVGESKFMLVGKEADGTEIYKTSDDVKSLPLSERKKGLINKIRNEYNGRTAKFLKNGAVYYATLNQTGVKKGVYGDKKSDTQGYKTKINIGADGNYFELVENSRYTYSRSEQGKKTNTNIHQDVKSWDYFIKRIKSDGEYFDVLINVADKGNDQYVYDITLNKSKKTMPSSSSKITTLNQEGTVSIDRISHDNESVNTHSMQKGEKDTNVKYMINPEFNKQYDSWDKKRHLTFEIGETSEALESVGVKNSKIYWDGTKILKILNKHTGMTDNVIKQVPYILEEPIIIAQSLQLDSRVTMFGDVMDENGKPVLAILELTPTNAEGLVLDEIKIASAYGKDNAQSLINRSKILYVEPDKKRTNAWLKSVQLQLPSSLTKFGSIDRISYDIESVNSYHMPNDKKNAKFMLPTRESDDSDIQLYRNMQYVKDISALERQVEVLKQEVKLTKGHKLSEKAVVQFATRMLNKYHSEYDFTMLKGEITDLFEYIANEKNIDWDNIVYQGSKMARNILSQSTTLNQELWNESKNFRQWLKATPFSLSEAQKQEVANYYGSYDSFRKSLFGSVNITDNGVQLHELWNDISNRSDFGYHFDGEINELEQPMKLKEFLEMVKPTYQNTYEMDMNTAALGVGLEIYDAYFDIPEVHTFADKKKQELINLKGQYRLRMGEWKKEYRTKYAEKLRQEKIDMRSKAKVSKSEALLRQKVHYQEIRSNERERRSKSLYKQQIKNIKKYFDERLLKPTEAKHFPKEFVHSVATVCNLLDMNTGRTKKDGSPTAVSLKLNEMNAEYRRLQADPDYLYRSEYDVEFADYIAELSISIKGKKVVDLTADELENVVNILKQFKHMLSTATKLIDMDVKQDVYHYAADMNGEIQAGKGNATFLTSWYNSNVLNPLRYARLLTNYNDNSKFVSIMQGFEDGATKQKMIIMDGTRMFDPVVKNVDANILKDFQGEKAKWVETRLSDGRIVKMTKAMRVSLYLLSKQDDGIRHIANGGITIPNEALYSKSVKNLKEKMRSSKHDVYRNSLPVRLTVNQINEITSGMSAYEKQFAKLAHQFFNEFTKMHINETSMKLYGFKKAGVEDYFPINTDKNFLSVDFDSVVKNASLEGKGFLKERKHGTNPIYLEDVTSAITRQLENTAMYAGLAIPLKNFRKVYNTTFATYSDGGDALTDFNSFGNAKYDGSIKETIAHKWGSASTKFIETLIADLQGANRHEFNMFDKIRNNFATAVLTANPRIVVGQLSAFPNAAAVLGWKPLSKVVQHRVLNKVDRDLIAKWTSQLWYHNQGYASREIGDIREQNQWSNKLPILVNGIPMMESAITGQLWYASEYFVQDHFKDLAKGTDEYYMKVAEMFDKTMKETQSNYSTMDRPQILRNQNPLLEFATMFSTQNLQNFGMAFDAIGNYKAKAQTYKTEGSKENLAELKEAKTQLLKTTSALIAQGATFVLLRVAVSAAFGLMNPFRDDEDELTAESILKKLGLDFASTLAGSALFGSQLFEIMTAWINKDYYYGISDPIIDKIDSLATSFANLGRISDCIKKGDNEKIIKTVNKFVCETIEICTGFPANNIEKYVYGIVTQFIDLFNGELGEYEAGKK